MFFEQNKADIRRDLDYSIAKGLHQARILAVLRENLSEFSKAFKDSPAVLKQGADMILENSISLELSIFLNNQVERTGYLFHFQATGPDILVRSFGAEIYASTLLFIEAKRLRSGSSNDYVKSGIYRFKAEEHGGGHDMAAMLGYVQEKDFGHWHSKVNSWILALVSAKGEDPKWTKEEQISKIQVADVGEYRSTHRRITEKPITLHHFWIDLCRYRSRATLN